MPHVAPAGAFPPVGARAGARPHTLSPSPSIAKRTAPQRWAGERPGSRGRSRHARRNGSRVGDPEPSSSKPRGFGLALRAYAVMRFTLRNTCLGLTTQMNCRLVNSSLCSIESSSGDTTIIRHRHRTIDTPEARLRERTDAFPPRRPRNRVVPSLAEAQVAGILEFVVFVTTWRSQFRPVGQPSSVGKGTRQT